MIVRTVARSCCCTVVAMDRLFSIGCRFFTVYGPWGRPDMAIFKFADRIVNNKAIPIYNKGNMKRDFTFVDDIVDGIMRLMQWRDANGHPQVHHTLIEPTTTINAILCCALRGTCVALREPLHVRPLQVFNLGNNHPVPVIDMIVMLETALGHNATIHDAGPSPGEIAETYSDTSLAETLVGFKPQVPLNKGIRRFVEWFHSSDYKPEFAYVSD